MKAVVFTAPGGPDVLHLTEHPDPVPAPGEAVVRIRAAALNSADLWVRRPGMEIKLPHISGSDAAGEIEEVNGSSNLKVGDSVLINPSLPNSAAQASGLGPYFDIVRILGYDTPGTYAQRIAVPIAQLYPNPEQLTFEEASALPLTFLTAWRMLASRAQLRPRERVFVWGATGGLGSAAVILAAHYFGAEVIAAVGRDSDAGTVRELGASHVVNYQNAPADAVRDVTGGSGVDVVFDSVGGPCWATTLSILRPGGRVVIAGTTAGDTAEHDLSDIFYYQWSILGSRMGDAGEFAAMLRAVDSCRLRPAIGQTFDLADASSAQERLESSDFVGKLVLRVP